MLVLDLFSGIGGFSLGLERTGGFDTVQFVERDRYAAAVLRKRWPHVPIHDDIRTFSAHPVDVVCGGFPCQDISLAGKGAGLEGDRSGLWWEMHRVIGEARPRWVIAENVPALRSRGLDQVLRSLASLGYDAEWHCVPAAALGAPHRRDRIWVLAYPNGLPSTALARPAQFQRPVLAQARREKTPDRSEIICAGEDVAYADGSSSGCGTGSGRCEAWEDAKPSDGSSVCYPDGDSQRDVPEHAEVARPSCVDAHAHGSGREEQRRPGPVWAELPAPQRFGWWSVEPPVGRVADGIPSRVDRLRCLGNAIVPQIAEAIGLAILEADRC